MKKKTKPKKQVRLTEEDYNFIRRQAFKIDKPKSYVLAYIIEYFRLQKDSNRTSMKPCLHCKVVREFRKKPIAGGRLYYLICLTCKRMAWVGKIV